MHKRWFHALFRRRVFIILLLLLQLGFFVYVIASGSLSSVILNRVLTVLSIIVAIHIVSKDDKVDYKIIWIFLILAFPVLGGLFYILFKLQSSTRLFQHSFLPIEKKGRPLFLLPGNTMQQAIEAVPDYAAQIRYLQDFAGFPIYRHSLTRYLSPGEEKFQALLKELNKAQRYIFMEYFIVQEGVMWNSILDILRRKVQEGVKVRIMYDDMGCFLLLPKNYRTILEGYGIECAVFNPFRPFLSALQNNRDHRKIAVIDGKVAFTGGINLADEYINQIDRFGHWKDASIMIKGHAAWSFTLMFLEMWNHAKRLQEDFSLYYPWEQEPCLVENDGFVLPYADSPMDKENVGEHVYLQLIHRAKNYIYINTPYLIVDETMNSALKLAAKSGVDVRIVTPHRWDKRFVHITTRSYYREFIRAGVKIYEYSKGFIHSKTLVSDDTVATVGTTNFDFRSLYLHFECGACMFQSKAVQEVKDDFLATFGILPPDYGAGLPV